MKDEKEKGAGCFLGKITDTLWIGSTQKMDYFFCSAMGQSTGGLSQQGLSQQEVFLQQGLLQSEDLSPHEGLS